MSRCTFFFWLAGKTLCEYAIPFDVTGHMDLNMRLCTSFRQVLEGEEQFGLQMTSLMDHALFRLRLFLTGKKRNN